MPFVCRLLCVAGCRIFADCCRLPVAVMRVESELTRPAVAVVAFNTPIVGIVYALEELGTFTPFAMSKPMALLVLPFLVGIMSEAAHCPGS